MKARELAELLRENFSKFDADDNIVAGGLALVEIR